MEKIRIKLVTIGHMPPRLNLSEVSAWRSEIFNLEGDIESFSLRCESDEDNWTFSDKILKTQLPANIDADFLIAIVNIPIEDNWYSRRLGNNQIVLTFNQIREFLIWENIPLENAIFRVLYSYALLYRRSGNVIPDFGAAPTFTHDETRGCLFDMNGVKSDLIESCNKPIICEECEERLRNERVSTQMIKTVQREIRKIRKPLYYRIFDFVRAKPIPALLLSSWFVVVLGITGSLAASYIYDGLKLQSPADVKSLFSDAKKTGS